MNRLKDEWENYISLCTDNEQQKTDQEAKKQFGKKVYAWCQTDGALPIRKDFAFPYVARGTYHTLADVFEVGWHPDYKNHFITNTKVMG